VTGRLAGKVALISGAGCIGPGWGNGRAAAVLFAVLAVLWLLAARGDRPEYRRASRLFVAGTAACAVLLAATALLPASARIPAWGLLDAVYLAGFSAVLLTASPAQAAAMMVSDALTERFGAFVIIVLGETLTGVVAGLAGQPVSGLTLAVGLVAVVVGFGAWWTYFDFAGQRLARQEPVPPEWERSRKPRRHKPEAFIRLRPPFLLRIQSLLWPPARLIRRRLHRLRSRSLQASLCKSRLLPPPSRHRTDLRLPPPSAARPMIAA